MNERELVDVESAYGSEVSSNSKFLKKKDTFTIEDSTSRNQIRWKWLKYKLREYMVLEAIFFLVLVFILITCYRISSQNQESHETIMKQIISQHQETQRMVLSIQSQLSSLQNSTGRDVPNFKEGTEKVDENDTEKTMGILEEVLKEVRMKSDVPLEQSQSVINNISKTEETHLPPIIPTAPSNSTLKRINTASLIAGSKIDKSLTSSSSLNPIFGFDQSNLVLVDRPVPPANKAWCTSDKNPVLTIKLAEYIKPYAVSYQHSKWNGTIPDDAPKEYSVVACLDNRCMTWKPLFSHCEYNPDGYQEQICNKISNGSLSSRVAKLQFRLHKNHGNTERTCVSLVRVYSETESAPEQTLRSLEDTTKCIDLNNDYHNNPLKYKYWDLKTCDVLYSKRCCQECPECCEECVITDGIQILASSILLCIIGIIVSVLIMFLFGLCLSIQNYYSKK